MPGIGAVRPFKYDLRVLREVSVPNGEPVFEIELVLHSRNKSMPEQRSKRCFTQSELTKLKRVLAETEHALRA